MPRRGSANEAREAAGWLSYVVVPSALSPSAILPSLLPAALLPGTLATADCRWVMESCVEIGSASIGLPGIMSLAIFVNPLLEAIPRIRREGDVGKLPLLPYSAMASQGVVWIVYGVLLGNPAIWTPNLCAMVLGFYYWYVYHRHCPPAANWLPCGRKHHVAAFLATATICSASAFLLPTASALIVLGLTGNVMTMAMFAGPLTALRTVVQDRSTRAMPFGFTVAVNINCNLWFFYAYFFLDDPFIYLQDGVGLLLTTVQLALFARYGIHR